MILYTYFRSSAAYRVRIALNLKGIAYDPRFVHLLKGGGEQYKAAYRALNPQGLVPTLVDNGMVLTQSLAIIEYLEDIHPEPPLLPPSAEDRAYVRSLAHLIACDIHPLNNLRVLNYLKNSLGADEEAARGWYRHWITEGFQALEAQLQRNRSNGRYCFGDHASLADICLIPQVYNAKRFNCDLTPYPTVDSIYRHCSALSAFRFAAPENQADSVERGDLL